VKNTTKIITTIALALFLTTGMSFADYLDNYDNITIWDGEGSDSGWYGTQEDNEVRPGAQTGQRWDLEGFFQNGSSLAMVGGFNFQDGEGWDGEPSPVRSGDLFIDTTGDAGQGGADNNYGYEYVLDLEFSDLTYDVVSLNNGATLEGVFTTFASSNPWRYASGGTVLSGYEDVSFGYTSGLTDDQVGLDGYGTNAHNLVSLDLSFLDPNTAFTLHFTQECGNDLLRGYGNTAPVPEPATMILFGFGLIGLAGIGRKNMKKC